MYSNINDMETLNAVLDRHAEIPAIYRHVDAALFGGYLPFTEHRRMVSRKAMQPQKFWWLIQKVGIEHIKNGIVWI